MFSFLLSLCLAHQPDGLLEVIERRDPIIYVANPTYGGATTRSQVLNPIILSVAPGHANSTFLKGYKNINVYVGANIGSLTECDYEADPLYCSLENDHWVLTTFINETPQTAVLVMTLYDNRGMIIGTSTRTKQPKRWLACNVCQTSSCCKKLADATLRALTRARYSPVGKSLIAKGCCSSKAT